MTILFFPQIDSEGQLKEGSLQKISQLKAQGAALEIVISAATQRSELKNLEKNPGEIKIHQIEKSSFTTESLDLFKDSALSLDLINETNPDLIFSDTPECLIGGILSSLKNVPHLWNLTDFFLYPNTFLPNFAESEKIEFYNALSTKVVLTSNKSIKIPKIFLKKSLRLSSKSDKKNQLFKICEITQKKFSPNQVVYKKILHNFIQSSSLLSVTKTLKDENNDLLTRITALKKEVSSQTLVLTQYTQSKFMQTWQKLRAFL
jgi:hypothetical protein